MKKIIYAAMAVVSMSYSCSCNGTITGFADKGECLFHGNAESAADSTGES